MLSFNGSRFCTLHGPLTKWIACGLLDWSKSLVSILLHSPGVQCTWSKYQQVTLHDVSCPTKWISKLWTFRQFIQQDHYVKSVNSPLQSMMQYYNRIMCSTTTDSIPHNQIQYLLWNSVAKVINVPLKLLAQITHSNYGDKYSLFS